MDSTHRPQLQGNTKGTYEGTHLRHVKMCYKRIKEVEKALDRAKLNFQRAVGELGVKEHEKFMDWVNHHKE